MAIKHHHFQMVCLPLSCWLYGGLLFVCLLACLLAWLVGWLVGWLFVCLFVLSLFDKCRWMSFVSKCTSNHGHVLFCTK